MPIVTLNLSEEKIKEIKSDCELLDMTKEEYVNWMFTIGKWVIQKSKEGKEVASLDSDTKDYTQFDTPHLEKLRLAYKLSHPKK